MLPTMHTRKPRTDRDAGEDDVPVEVDTVDLSEIAADVRASSGGGGNSVITAPIAQIRGPEQAPYEEQEMPANKRRQPSPGSLRHIMADRPIFTLSVAADLLGLHPRTLRIYEEKGLVIPARTEGNRRRYSQIDIAKFQAIRLLTRGGVNLEGVRIILDMAEELTRLGSNPTAIIERNLQTGDQGSDVSKQ